MSVDKEINVGPMKTYTYSRGSLSDGISVVQDEKFGPVVFLGEEGRGRRYEKISVSRKAPAEIVDNKIFEAEPTKITLSAGEGKSEKTFFVLSNSKIKRNDEAVFIRINTEGTYTRNTIGCWETMKGDPETVILGNGAYGDAGRIGRWDDGLVIMRPGDALKVTLSGGYKFRPKALFFDDKNNLTTMDFEEWKALRAVESFDKTKTEQGEKNIEILFGTMPAFSFSANTGWKLESGIKTKAFDNTRSFRLGPEKRDDWTVSNQVTIMASAELPNVITEASLAKLDSNLILTTSEKSESGKFLIRVNTEGFNNVRGYATVKAVRGKPEIVAEAMMEHGYNHQDDLLVVMSKDDVLRIGQPDESFGGVVIYFEDGQLRNDDFFAWEIRDACKNTAPYVEKGLCPIPNLPESWIGKVIESAGIEHRKSGSTYLVKSVNPTILVSGWDSINTSDVHEVSSFWKEDVWAYLTDLKAESEIRIIEEDEIVQFNYLPMKAGTRAIAKISTEKVDFGDTRYGPTVERPRYHLEIPNITGQKYHITKYDKSGQVHEEKNLIGDAKATYRLDDTGYIIHSPDGVKELNGEYVVEFCEKNQDSWYIKVLTPEMLEKEKEQILAEIKSNLPYRKYAQILDSERGVYGMPIKKGVGPCKPEDADYWCLYGKEHPWINSYPEAYIMVSYKGYRSLTTGKTFEELLKNFNRK